MRGGGYYFERSLWSCQVIFEQKPEGTEGQSHVSNVAAELPDRRNS